MDKNKLDDHATDLRKSEESFRTLANNISQLAWMADAQGTIFWYNQRWYDYTGTSLDEMYGWGWQKVHHPDHVQRVVDKIRLSFDAGVIWEDTFPLRARDGTYRWFLSRAVPVRDEHGQVFRWCGTNTDITERLDDQARIEALNASLQAQAIKLEAANQAKSAFLANMSHELRTPLNAILGFSDLLKRDAHTSPAQRETLGIISKSGDHLLSLINDVLDIAKIEAGHLTVHNAPFDLGAMILDATGMMRVRAAGKGLQLALSQASSFPRYIMGDEARLRQVLINLIANAINATEEGGVTLRLGLQHKETQHLVLEVEDTGCGISTEDQAKLMQPFVQLGSSDRQQGTGLGLTISRQLVELMGGQLTHASELGKGSVFRVDLPVQLVQAQDISEAAPSLGDVLALAPGQPSRRILVVEDQLDNQILLTRLLQGVGFDVRLAENGVQGVAAFQDWQPDFIWMDRHMPVMDGVQATQKIRALEGGGAVKIAAVTASTFREEDAELAAAGFDGIVHKPYRAEQIFSCMERLLGVQFIRAAEHAEHAGPAAAPANAGPPSLSALPEALRAKLKEALIMMEPQSIQAGIDAIGKDFPDIAAALREQAQRHAYIALVASLDGL
jgi:PAS domain S-box-containing protein